MVLITYELNFTTQTNTMNIFRMNVKLRDHVT